MTYKDMDMAQEDREEWQDAQLAFLSNHMEVERKLKRRARARKIKMFLWLVLAWACFLGVTLWPLIAPLIHKFTA